MDKISVNLQAPLMFVFMAYFLKDILADDPAITLPGEKYVFKGNGTLTQKLGGDFSHVAFGFETYLGIRTFQVTRQDIEEMEVVTSDMLAVSFNPVLRGEREGKQYNIEGVTANMFNSLDGCQRIYEVFNKSFFMAGTTLEDYEYRHIDYQNIISSLKFVFRVRTSVRQFFDTEGLYWIEQYLAKMEKAVSKV